MNEEHSPAHHEKLQLLLSALEYLDTSECLSYILVKCDYHCRNSQNLSAYRFVLDINPMSITDLNVKLGNLILHQPVEGTSIFQEVVYTTIKCLELLPASVNRGQVQVILRLLDLPSLPLYVMKDCRDPQQNYDKQHFLKFVGIVCGMTMPTKYTQSARYVCPIPECLGSTGNMFIRLHVAGAKEVNTISKFFTCPYCSSQLEEDVACRQLSDMIIVDMINENVFRSPNLPQRRYQAVTAIVRDELTTRIQMGEKLCVIGCMATNESSAVASRGPFSLVFEVNNVLQIDKGIRKTESVIPASIKRLFDDHSESCWSFALSLAYIFGGNITPMGTYIHLKLGLLLCLTGSNSNNEEAEFMHLLVIGQDTLLIDRLMKFALSFTERSAQHTAGSHLTGNVTKDRHGTGASFVEAGSLLHAGDGVCYLRDVGQMNKGQTEVIQKVLESKTITLTVPFKPTAGLAQQVSYPLKCSVWAHTEPVTVKCISGSDSRNRDIGNVSKSLADVFGMVYFTETETKKDAYAESVLIQHTLEMSMNPDGCTDNTSFITDQDLRQFIRTVGSRNVDFSCEAESLICGFYIGSRRMRASGIQGTQFPLTAMKTLKLLAKAHAKLSLRSSVTSEDAVMAIWLYEESMTARFGYPVIPLHPLCHVRDANFGNYLGPNNDKKMRHFQDLLLRFCSAHSGDVFMEE